MTPDRLALLAMLVAGVALFVMLPALIAYATRHPERRRIAGLAPLGALSFLLWGALLVWAIGGRRDDSVIARFVDRQRKGLVWVVVALVVGGLAVSGWAWSQRGTLPTAEAGSSANSPSTPAAT